ncbi:MAG: hypothetical protein R3B09_01790 [Nannocystaceae bacterium]
MPLIDINSGQVITRMPYKGDFDVLRRRLTGAEFDAIVREINARIEAAGGEIAARAD